jgi:AcrR family transcriptional regulator
MAETSKTKSDKKAADTLDRDAIRSDIVDAAMRLAADLDWEEVRLSDIAAEAGVTLAALRGAFDSKDAILGGLTRAVDRAVLAETDPDMVDEPARERLFDVLMRRFDALQPYQPALRRIARSYRGDLLALLAFNSRARRSMQWMLEAAGVDASGRIGLARAQVLVIAYGRTLEVFLREEDPGMARTMAALDRNLRQAERFARMSSRFLDGASGFGRMARSLADALGRGRRRRRYNDEDAYEAGYDDYADDMWTDPDDDGTPDDGGRKLH